MKTIKTRVKLEKEGEGKYRLHVVSDYSAFLKENAEIRKVIGKGISKSKVWRRVARIPITVLLSLPPERAIAILNDPKEMDKFLREHPEFRVSEGEI